MSCGAAQKPEAFAGMLFEQSLDFELGFGGAGQRSAQMEQRDLFRFSSLEWRLREGERCASQDAVDEEEISETIGVKGLNSPPLHYAIHSHYSPALSARNYAPGKLSKGSVSHASEFESEPQLYGKLFRLDTGFATGAGA